MALVTLLWHDCHGLDITEEMERCWLQHVGPLATPPAL
jgi:hypothetical protein